MFGKKAESQYGMASLSLYMYTFIWSWDVILSNGSLQCIVKQLALWLRCNSRVLDTSEGKLWMFLFAFLLSLPLFPHFSYSKQFLVELKSGKNKIRETNIGNGTGDIGNGNGTDARQKNEEGENQRRPKPDHKKVKNGDESQLTSMKTTRESRLTTTDKISQGDDYFLFEFVCFMFQFCPFGNPFTNPTEPTRPTFVPGNYDICCPSIS